MKRYDYGIHDAEDFIDDVKGRVSAISAEIDHSQTRREEAARRNLHATVAYERSYEKRLREEIQND